MESPPLGWVARTLRERSPLCLGSVAVAACGLVLLLVFGPAIQSEPLRLEQSCQVAHSISGTSGQLFSGAVIRKFPGRLLLQALEEKDLAGARAAPAAPGKGMCEFWGVVTTIFEPSPAIKEFTARFPAWCLVVVGDKKTPPYPQSA